jgi:hypothetical protein
MFDHTHYVPILKGKPGELMGLSHLSAAHWGAITPLIEIPSIPLDWPGEIGVSVPAKTIAEHVEKVIVDLAKTVPQQKPFFIDGGYIEHEDALPNKQEPIAEIVASLVKAGLHPIPVVGIRRVFEYLTAAKTIHRKHGHGLCLRIAASEMFLPIGPRITQLLELLLIKPDKIHLILDYGAIDDERAEGPKKNVSGRMTRLAEMGKWKTMTVSATAIPQNMSKVSINSLKVIPRHEWDIWLTLRGRRSAIIPTFGDYAATHPVQQEIDPRIINKSPSIKYTTDDSWVFAKGKARPKKAGAKTSVPPHSVQYPMLAQRLMEMDEWCGEDFSWGDERIAECVAKRAAKKKATGGAAEWIAVATSHHIAVVVNQIANLPAL